MAEVIDTATWTRSTRTPLIRGTSAGLVLLAVTISAVTTGCQRAVEPTPSSTAGPATTTVGSSCPSGVPLARIVPPARTAVRLRVINASGRPGLDAEVALEFRGRGLQVVATSAQSQRLDGVALLRYGPSAVGAAWEMRPYFAAYAATGPPQDAFEVSRTGDIVDVVLGTRFTNLATVTEVNQATAAMALPTAPAGTCASPTPSA